MQLKFPYKYVIEMFCDFVGAGKAYMGEKWSPAEPLKYHNRTKKKRVYHKDTLELLDLLMSYLNELGEKEFFKWYKRCKSILKDIYEYSGSGKTFNTIEALKEELLGK